MVVYRGKSCGVGGALASHPRCRQEPPEAIVPFGRDAY